MAFQSPQHLNANALQKSLLLDLLGATDSKLVKGKLRACLLKPADRCAMIRVWIELEYLKREMRGIPRLKACDIETMIKRAKRALNTASAEPEEVPDFEPKETLVLPETTRVS